METTMTMGSAISKMEQVDVTLRELCTSLQLMRAGAEYLANGEMIADVMNCVGRGLQSARANLDEAMSAVISMRASA